jgi:hypothetical protein
MDECVKGRLSVVDENQWTPELLRQHFNIMLAEIELRHEQRYASQQQAVLAALMAQEKAITKAEIATEKRLEALNELRGMVTDAQAMFASRNEMDISIAGLREALVEVKERLAQGAGKGSGYQASWTLLLGVIGMLTGVLGIAGFVLTWFILYKPG